MVDFENKKITLKEQEEKALQIVSRIVESISSGSEVKMVSSNEEYIIFEISKADPGIIIGKHGHTLDAIQYLVNLIIHKGNEQGIYKRYIVDIDGYRKRREESLQKYAREKAEIAKRKGNSIALYFMSSIERKLVHMVLKEDPDVTTYSEGREPYRRIIIKPILAKDKDDEKIEY